MGVPIVASAATVDNLSVPSLRQQEMLRSPVVWRNALAIAGLVFGLALIGAGADPVNHQEGGTTPTSVAIPSDLPTDKGNHHGVSRLYYSRNWGIDIIGLKRVASGFMLQFSYRITDPDRAAPVNDKAVKPYLIDKKTGARLAVPNMENIGDLRQSVVPEAQRVYFMIFGNPGRLVARGDHVSVVAGGLVIDDLIVE